jgi:glycosyltransferase 2 family protein
MNGTAPGGAGSASSTKAKHWRWSGPLILLASAAICWVLYLHWREMGFRWDVFAASFKRLEWGWVAVSAVFSLLAYYGRALRWAVMIRPLQSSVRIRDLFSATAIGFAVVVLLGRAGELVRPYIISVKARVSFSSQIAAWFLERMMDLLAILIVFGFSLTQIRTRAHVGPALRWVLEVGGILSLATGLACLAILIALAQYSDSVRSRLAAALRILPERFHERVDGFVSAFVEGTAATKRQSSVLLLVVYTALEWVLVALCYISLFRAFGSQMRMGVLDVVTFMAFVAFGGVVQIPGIGGGLQLIAVLVLTELFRQPLEVATSAAILLWGITFVVVVPVGLLLAFHEGLNWSKLKALRREAEL